MSSTASSSGKQARQHAAQRHADDGGGDGDGAVFGGCELRRHGGGAGQCAADAEAGDQAQDGDGQHVGCQADGAGGGAEDQHAADDGPAAAEAVGEQAGAGTAEAHADQAGGDCRGEGAAGDTPFFDQYRNGKADQLAVEAVHDDGQCGQADHELLHRGEDAVVQGFTDVDGGAHAAFPGLANTPAAPGASTLCCSMASSPWISCRCFYRYFYASSALAPASILCGQVWKRRD